MIVPKVVSNAKPKKIVFDDDGEVLNDAKQISKKTEKSGTQIAAKEDHDGNDTGDEEEDYFSIREKKSKQKSENQQENSDVPKKWYNVVRMFFHPIIICV